MDLILVQNVEGLLVLVELVLMDEAMVRVQCVPPKAICYCRFILKTKNSQIPATFLRLPTDTNQIIS